ncbi:MAG TPA: hypothetical protein PK772_00130 [Chitinophagaceae bacterium]|nr:hypothetical protein [Chitinophagaceae bacterium]
MPNQFLCWITITMLFSCKNSSDTKQEVIHPNSTDLFANDKKDSIPIPVYKDEQLKILSPDSAFEKSTLVAICFPLSIDSFYQNNKTVFYLTTVKPLHILKGEYSNNKNISFILNTASHFLLNDSGWVVYLQPVKEKKLITQNNIQWQWLNNAPYHKALF